MRPLSKIAPDWWDYTTLDRAILDDAARLSPQDLLGLSREGFAVKFYDTREEFYLAEALEYITAWRHDQRYRNRSSSTHKEERRQRRHHRPRQQYNAVEDAPFPRPVDARRINRRR